MLFTGGFISSIVMALPLKTLICDILEGWNSHISDCNDSNIMVEDPHLYGGVKAH